MLRAAKHVTEYDEYGNIAAYVHNFYSVNDHVTSIPQTEMKQAHAGILSIGNNTIKWLALTGCCILLTMPPLPAVTPAALQIAPLLLPMSHTTALTLTPHMPRLSTSFIVVTHNTVPSTDVPVRK
jgi:hypothetical protein